ncbi:MAG: CHAT domain-containing protein [Cyanobacteria bacterium P01_G01_bin.39]
MLSLSLILGFELDVTAQVRAGLVSSVNPKQLVAQAHRQYHQGKPGAAIHLLEQAQAIYRQQQQLLPQAQVLALISLAQQQLGNWQLAHQNLERSFALIQNIPSSKAKTQALGQMQNAKGHYHYAKGQHKQAYLDWQQAEKLYRQLNDPLGIAGTILDQAEALTKMGFHRRSCNLILVAFEQPEYRCLALTDSQIKTIINQAQDKRESWQVAGLNSMGNSLLSMGRLVRAQTLIRASYRLESNSRVPLRPSAARGRSSSMPRFDPINHAKTLLSLGNINRAIAFQKKARSDWDSFVSHSQQAIRYYQQLKHNQAPLIPKIRSYQIMGQLNQLSLLIATEKWSQARTLANKIQLELLQQANPYAPIKFASSLERLKQHRVTIKYSWYDLADMYRGAIEQAQVSGNRRLESYGWGYLGKLSWQQHLKLKNTPQQQLQQALLLAQTENAPEIAYRWQWRLGQIYRQQQQKPRAIALYQAALTNLGNLRGDLTLLSREVQFNFQEKIEPVYREFADLLLDDSASDYELELARNVIEILQVAELDNYFQDACITFEPKSIEQIDSDAAVVYTIILPDRLEVILAASRKEPEPHKILRHHTYKITQKELESKVKLLRRYIAEPDRLSETRELSAQVYNWLLRPLVSDLKQQHPKTLVFVLDGILQTIPMAALYDGQHYLLEKYALALTPGLRLVNPQKNSQQNSFVAGGISKYLRVEEQEFAALTKVPQELTTFNNWDSQVLLNEKFTPSNLLEQLNSTSANMIHLATHGQFRPNPQQTFLLMWQKLLTIQEFSILLQSHIKAIRNPIDLLVLSACDTAIGDRRAALGLAGIAVRSGSLSTLATLWQVNDDSTAELMQHFYQNLKGTSKAEALRQAQLQLWSTPDKDWQVPAFWSAYIIIGNWQ